jgi:hypothetical protein
MSEGHDLKRLAPPPVAAAGIPPPVAAAGIPPPVAAAGIPPPVAAAGIGTPQALATTAGGAGSTGTVAAHDARIGEYEQVGSQFRALTDIRFKLIGFLPAGTIATVLAAKDAKLVSEPAVATFGLLVTLSLATYNKRNDQLYDELISRAAQLERELGLARGAFSQRPTPWLSFGPWKVEHRWPVGFVYAVSAAIWTYVLVRATTPELLVSWEGMTFGPVWPWLGAICVLIVWLILGEWEKSRADALEAIIVKLKDSFGTKSKDELVKLMAQDETIRALFRRPKKAAEKIEKRLTLHEAALQAAQKAGPDYDALSLILSNVIDLPARWIHDVWTGRR